MDKKEIKILKDLFNDRIKRHFLNQSIILSLLREYWETYWKWVDEKVENELRKFVTAKFNSLENIEIATLNLEMVKFFEWNFLKWTNLEKIIKTKTKLCEKWKYNAFLTEVTLHFVDIHTGFFWFLISDFNSLWKK